MFVLDKLLFAQKSTQVQIRQAVPPNHAPPGLTVIACVSIKDSQKDNWRAHSSPPPSKFKKAG